MFLKRLFAKDYRHYLERGDRYFAEERYSDARHAFLDALKKIEGGGDAEAEIRRKVSEAGDRLALANIAEAEYAAGRGDSAKAEEHLTLALELAEAASIREKAEGLMGSLTTAAEPVEPAQAHHHCSGGCSHDTVAPSGDGHLSADHLSAHERFELLIQTLPESLPKRYAELGERFSNGYLLVHDGNEKDGFRIYQELLKEGENDILLYEIALLNHRNGNVPECERLLRRAISLNDGNPLCYLGLVQLLTDTGRFTESIPLLNHMIDRQLLIDQAIIFLGDVYQRLGNDDEAMGKYSKALDYPAAAKAAAERLVPLLQKQGRVDDATYLAKRYLKGCC